MRDLDFDFKVNGAEQQGFFSTGRGLNFGLKYYYLSIRPTFDCGVTQIVVPNWSCIDPSVNAKLLI